MTGHPGLGQGLWPLPLGASATAPDTNAAHRKSARTTRRMSTSGSSGLFLRCRRPEVKRSPEGLEEGETWSGRVDLNHRPFDPTGGKDAHCGRCTLFLVLNSGAAYPSTPRTLGLACPGCSGSVRFPGPGLT